MSFPTDHNDKGGAKHGKYCFDLRETPGSEENIKVCCDDGSPNSPGSNAGEASVLASFALNSQKGKTKKFYWRWQYTVAASVLGLILALALGLGIGLTRTHNKETWPECVGLPGETCKHIIEKERPDLKVYIGSIHGAYTLDYASWRVRVFVDDNSITTRPPHVG